MAWFFSLKIDYSVLTIDYFDYSFFHKTMFNILRINWVYFFWLLLRIKKKSNNYNLNHQVLSQENLIFFKSYNFNVIPQNHFLTHTKKKPKNFPIQRCPYLNYITASHIWNTPPSQHTDNILPETGFSNTVNFAKEVYSPCNIFNFSILNN